MLLQHMMMQWHQHNGCSISIRTWTLQWWCSMPTNPNVWSPNQLHIDHGMIWVELKSMVSDSTDIGTIFLEIIKCGANLVSEFFMIFSKIFELNYLQRIPAANSLFFTVLSHNFGAHVSKNSAKTDGMKADKTPQRCNKWQMVHPLCQYTKT